MVIHSQEANRDTPHTSPKIYFHVYRNVSLFTLHFGTPYKDGRTCSMCYTMSIIM